MNAAAARVAVWDVPTRIVHWLMVICFGVSWWSAETRWLDYHRYSGYTLLTLLLFRVVWGFIGSESARFASFVRGPAAAFAYLKTLPKRGAPVFPGHNPLGAWSVLAMLALLATQITLGLFSVDVDGIESGPLSDRVSFDVGRVCAHWHHRVFNVLLAFIGLHLLAIAYYWAVKRHNLVGSMITGRARIGASREAFRFTSPWRAVIVIVVSAVLVWLVSRGFRING